MSARPCENRSMDKPMASGPAEIFTRLDDYTVTNAAAAEITKTPADVPVIVEFTVSVAVTVLKPTLFSMIGNVPTPLVSWESAGSTAAGSVPVK